MMIKEEKEVDEKEERKRRAIPPAIDAILFLNWEKAIPKLLDPWWILMQPPVLVARLESKTEPWPMLTSPDCTKAPAPSTAEFAVKSMVSICSCTPPSPKMPPQVPAVLFKNPQLLIAM